ncbi:MAG TPA: 2-hydroxychromene-2-carboxylate isomerase [Castellaniella sp.]|nr:2-hydroxychromene-2-carboxylate isomerase [Castellaniella sp.]
MSSALDFYFDFSSPYGYFASTRIDELAKDLGREARWHPVLLGPIFKATGMAPLVQIPLKGEYSRRDMTRTARLHQIPFDMPEPFPIATVAAARIMLHLDQGDPDMAKAYARRAFEAYYVRGVNIGEPAHALQLVSDLGLDRERIGQAIATDAVKALLREANDAALARGVFGSPFVIVDDEPFWGFDRLEAVRMWARATAAGA